MWIVYLHNFKRLILDLLIYYLRSLNPAHGRVGGTDAEKRFQLVHAGWLPANQDFHPAIMEIPGVTMKAEPATVAGHKPAKADPLDFPTHQKFCGRHSERARLRRCHMM